MKEFGGWLLPDKEKHLIGWMQNVNIRASGRLTYQYSKLQKALTFTKKFRTAVDVGAHVGLWSFYLAQNFRNVYAFEPVLEHRMCFDENMRGLSNVRLCAYALGDHSGLVTLHTGDASSGDTYVKAGGEHGANLRMLDSFALEEVDFLKIDCEGYEKFVLLGGEQTIRRDKPCIIVEQKPGKAQQFGLGEIDAVTLLQAWGAQIEAVMAGDYIMGWRA